MDRIQAAAGAAEPLLQRARALWLHRPRLAAVLALFVGVQLLPETGVASPRTLLFVLAAAVLMIVWAIEEHGIGASPLPRLDDELERAVDASLSGPSSADSVALQGLLQDTLSLMRPWLSSWLAFALNNVLAQRSPLPPIFENPTVRINVGTVAPLLYNFKRRRDTDGHHLYTMDMTLDNSDAEATLSAVGLDFSLRRIRLSGRLMLRIDKATSEVFVAFSHYPMLRVEIVGPSNMLSAALAGVVEEQLRATLVRPNWMPLYSMTSYVWPRQQMLEWYQSRAPYSKSCALALDAALQAMTVAAPLAAATPDGEHDDDDSEDADHLASEFVLLDESAARKPSTGTSSSSSSASSAPAPVAAAAERIVPVGTISASPAMLVTVDLEGHVYERADGDVVCLTRQLTAPLAVGTPPRASHAHDAHGVGCAWLSAGAKVTLAFRAAGASHWWWREVPAPEGERAATVGCILSSTDVSDEWHVMVLTVEGSVVAHSCRPWDARSAWRTTKLLLSARCVQVTPLQQQSKSGAAGVLCVLQSSCHQYRPVKGEWVLGESMALQPGAVAAAWQTSKMVLVTSIDREGRVWVNGVQVACDAVGAPAVAVLRNDVFVVFRDIMGHLCCVSGAASEWRTGLRQTDLSEVLHLQTLIAAWDPSVSLVGLQSLRILWIASDGFAHRLEGTPFSSFKSWKHDVVAVISAHATPR